jgi:hypothetical protein
MLSYSFEAPDKPSHSVARDKHHTIFVVDTSLTRDSRIRKPSQRMKESVASRRVGRKHIVSQLSEMSSEELLDFLKCSEDTSFMFQPVEAAPAVANTADILDTASMPKLDRYCERVLLVA